MDPAPSAALAPASLRRSVTAFCLGLAALFALAHLGAAGSLAGFHGDERFYTDATLEMAARGEWTLPRYADGSPRFNKPLLVYWLLGGSFELLGVGPLAARLPSLLAMAAAIVVTARLALVATGSAATALGAAAVYAATSATTSTAVRATPDALQALGVAVALLGLARLLTPAAPRRAALGIWLGVGLVIAAKLGLGALVAGFVVVAACAAGGDEARGGVSRATRLRRLLSPFALAPGLALAAAGTLPMLLGHGDALRQSFADQVGSRVPPSLGFVAQNVLAYAAAPLRHFAPFSLVALGAAWLAHKRRDGCWPPWLRTKAYPPTAGRYTPDSTPPVVVSQARGPASHDAGAAAAAGATASVDTLARKRWLALAFGFTATLVLVFGLGNLHRSRYLLPAYPLVATLVAAALAQPAPGVARLLRGMALAIGVTLVGLGAVLVREPRVAVVGVGVGGALVALAARARAAPAASLPVAAAALLAASAFVVSDLRPAFPGTPVPAILAALGPGPRVVAVLDPGEHDLADVAAHLRLESEGQVRAFTVSPRGDALRAAFAPELGPAPAIVAPLSRAAQIAAAFPAHAQVGAWPRVRAADPGDLLDWALQGGARPPHDGDGDDDPPVLGLWLPRAPGS